MNGSLLNMNPNNSTTISRGRIWKLAPAPPLAGRRQRLLISGMRVKWAAAQALAILCGLLLALACPACRGATITWTNTSGGNWSAATNWSPNQVPGSSDTPVITSSGTYTVNLDINATVAGMILGGSSGTQTF